MSAEKVIAALPPNDGREWDCQCARCGSSMGWHDCDNCADGLTGHDCGEDSCCCLYPEDNVECEYCCGRSGWNLCLSSEAWCEAHPLPERERCERGEVEWFTLDARREAPHG